MTTTMKAAVFREPGRIELEERPVPTTGADELLVRVRAASICGTDLRIARHGHFRLPLGTPRVLGHEVAGEVVEAGAATGFAAGERVSVTPNVGCGRCEFCRDGLNNMCPDYEAFGITLDGGFAEYLRVPAIAVQRGNVFRLPPSLTFTEAALVEPLSCCLRGQDALDVRYGDVVVIVGAGPIGICHVQLARLAGARRIIVANRSAPRLDAAKRAGADVLVQAAGDELREVVAEHTDGRGADVVITCVSSPEVQSAAVELLATHGRLNFFAGLGQGGTVAIDTNRLHYRGLVLTGTTGSSNADYARALELVGDGRVDVASLVSRAFGIDEIHDALAHAASGRGMKAVITFGEEQS